MKLTKLSKLAVVGSIGWVAWTGCFSSSARADLLAFPDKPVDSRLAAFRKAINGLHQKALKSRKAWKEKDLRKKVPSSYLRLGARYAKLKDQKRLFFWTVCVATIFHPCRWTSRFIPTS